ncbi:uncharacterized protein LOC129773533 [Toxorhynchites rutilus septentrionalis]|uniref:uncharacterized protein LOC129765658 n=1 Tax=Toxorhynchites rutilus septentrionalis TaxID=329112 RepID=UPI002478DC07|nr:uncharacterized protein LOC129765658 [Toxorhynchites rutilus septentrionalis]XP_055633122.1 uncharacterized protein LOC129773533 [Toxorhynchites rutilus septentrionalis]
MPSENLRLLSKQERVLRISLENVADFVQSYEEGTDKQSLELRLAKLDELLEKFINIRMQMEILADDADDMELTETKATEEERIRQRDTINATIIKDFENSVYDLKQTILSYLTTANRNHPMPNGSRQSTVDSQSRVKLPDLRLPSFSGRMSDWVTFRDTYKNLIHNDVRLSDMDKFTYLRTSLTGDALQEIASIEICSNNYIIAWNALESITDQYGNSMLARALLDSGSQRCYMSESFSQKLKFKRSREHLPVVGIGGSCTASTQAVLAEMNSCVTEYTTRLKFHVLPRVTVNLPVQSININSWKIPNEVVLADTTFHESRAVDLIIGAEIYLDIILESQQIKLTESGPTLQNTQLGWIVSGTIPDEACCYSSIVSHSSESVEDQLMRFFELELCRTTSTFSLEETACEKHFERTTKKDCSGKFIVHLPKKPYLIDRLGESRSIALRRFSALEKRLNANVNVKQMYSNFINEYRNLNHMREVLPIDEEKSMQTPYYMPHHAVLKPDSTSTKLRVVFDASCPSSSGISLNAALMVGPVVQDDLYSIILRFRLHKYAIIADIEKMYRMINVDPADYHLQRILWRDDPSEPIRTFELTTVTYGTSPAPYLATRCLKKLAEDNKPTYPIAAETILNGFYVDDLLKSVGSIDEASKLCRELILLLSAAGFTLRKWSTNSCEILEQIPIHLRSNQSTLELQPSGDIKTLGLIWSPNTDMFKFTVPQWHSSSEITKRIILSDFAKLFDPLGLVGPVTVQAKVFLQELWKTKCSWDVSLAEEHQNWWLKFRSNLAGLSHLEIPRWVAFDNDIITVEMHGFCDASEKAYGACLYLRCISFNGTISVSLLTAKSRVAPIDNLEKKKRKISIPRLELSSALVCSHLFEKAAESIKLSIQPYFWTDSMIVKCWLSSVPSRWNIFVANRVSEIQHITRKGIWNHVAGAENPADALSRGMTPDQLLNHQTWWHGPQWLHLEKEEWPKSVKYSIEELNQATVEQRATVSAPAQEIKTSFIFTLKSKLSDLVRIVALVRRFIYNCRNCQNRKLGFLTYEERESALLRLVALAQEESFHLELTELKTKNSTTFPSRIRSLNPRLVNGLLLVGGRLNYAQISVGRKHPLILDNRHPLTTLIATHYHETLLHAGQQLMISSMRERFWPIGARNVTRKVIHRCLKCFRTRPKSHEQIMGDLPVERVTPAPPFTRVGVDYCGPFNVQYPYRKGKPIKCFIAVFICLVVKAIHLEIVADLTTQSFIAALKRFVARRGRPEIIICDNGRNFVGARRELDELRRLFNNQRESISKEAATENINFKFIPARSPNFGGLWEAAVKSMKSHMKRTLGNVILHSDELATLVAQIEACLNSRPITPLSNDPNDLTVLTPGHFLINRPLMAIPEPSLQEIQESRLSKWQRVQNYLQQLWRRWSTQYLSNLQNRTKWTKQRKNLFVGTMVLLRDENLPPLKWSLGRIIDIHTGEDGNIRVVKVRTKDGVYVRAISKVCILPIADNESPSTEE